MARVILESMPELDLEHIYDAHSQALFAFLLNLTRNEAETRDLLQEIFIKLAKQPALLEAARDSHPPGAQSGD